MRPYILAEANWRTVQTSKYDLAVLPWGATEAHNYHLPYATDNYEATAISAESARKAWNASTKVIVLPTIPFGVNTGQLDIPLTMNLLPSTQFQILNDVISNVHRSGIRRFIILNSHGGNDFRQILRELGSRFPDMFLAELDWFRMKEQETIFDDLGEHGGEIETSLIMHLHPELMRPLQEAGDGKNKKIRFQAHREGWAWAERKWTKVTSDTGIGNPAKSSAEKGKQFFELMTDKIASYFGELCKTDLNELYE